MKKLIGLLAGLLVVQSLWSTHAVAEELSVGKTAPDFTLPSSGGGPVTLSDFRNKKVVVVYFYPKDETGGCTKESCTFRDKYQDFKDAGAEVIGISSDSVESHKGFVSHYSLPFTLVSDEGGKLRKTWGVPGALMFPGRVTYVIDKEGKVCMMFNSAMEPEKHVKMALDMVKKLAEQTQSASPAVTQSATQAESASTATAK
jgi:thioredoxin-dependent peroxiredoxin